MTIKRWALADIAFAIIIVSGLVVRHYWPTLTSIPKTTTKQTTSTTPTAEPKLPTTTSDNNSDQTITAGGQPVPASSQAKAKKLGYYCPSWESKSGNVASTVCIVLDK